MLKKFFKSQIKSNIPHTLPHPILLFHQFPRTLYAFPLDTSIETARHSITPNNFSFFFLIPFHTTHNTHIWTFFSFINRSSQTQSQRVHRRSIDRRTQKRYQSKLWSFLSDRPTIEKKKIILCSIKHEKMCDHVYSDCQVYDW